jgi:hypothetical protein
MVTKIRNAQLGFESRAIQDVGADAGFVVRWGMSRRGLWGPLKVPIGSKAEPW